MSFTTLPINTITTVAYNGIYNVKDPAYGAKGDGVTDDTVAINSAIAAFNNALKGMLYFPPGVYKVTSSLSTITGQGMIFGAGSQATRIDCSTTTNIALFTVNYSASGSAILFESLQLFGPGIGLAASGSTAILVTSTNAFPAISYNNLFIQNFYDAVDIRVGNEWYMSNCTFFGAAHYGMRIQNTINNDAGDWAIVNTSFAGTNIGESTSQIRIESSGGGKICNCKFNTGPQNAIDVSASGATSDLQIANCSIENFSVFGITCNGVWPNITIVGVELGIFGSNSATAAINIVNNNTISISGIVIDGNNYGSNNPIHLSGVTDCLINDVIWGGTPTGSLMNADSSFDVAARGQMTQSVNGQRLVSNSTGAQLSMESGAASSTISSAVYFKNSEGTLASPTNLATGDVIGGIAAQAYVSGYQFNSFAGFVQEASNKTAFYVLTGSGGTRTEAFRVNGSQQVQFSAAPSFSANGSVATALTSIGPTGSHTTVQTWLTIIDNTGTTRYIPCF